MLFRAVRINYRGIRHRLKIIPKSHSCSDILTFIQNNDTFEYIMTIKPQPTKSIKDDGCKRGDNSDFISVNETQKLYQSCKKNRESIDFIYLNDIRYYYFLELYVQLLRNKHYYNLTEYFKFFSDHIMFHDYLDSCMSRNFNENKNNSFFDFVDLLKSDHIHEFVFIFN